MKSKNVLSRFAVLLAATAVCNGWAMPVLGQISLTAQNPSYSQNFNSLSSAGTWQNNQSVAGWYAAPYTGSAAIGMQLSAGNNNTGAGLKSFGVTNDTDRSLGSISSQTDDGFYYGVRLANNTGKLIKNLRINFNVELWAKDAGNITGTLALEYQVGTNISDLKAGTWQAATALNPSVVTGGSSAAVFNGNNNQTPAAYGINDVNLGSGQEIMLRWFDTYENKHIYLSIDDLTVTASYTNIFYNKAGTNPSLAASWASNPDGTGASPLNFSVSDQLFVVNKNQSLTSNWTLSGANSKLIVGDGTTAVEFIIADGVTFTGTIDVADNGTLTINSASNPTLGELAPLSTVNYNYSATTLTGTVVQTVPNADYANLSVGGNGSKKLLANTRVRKNLKLNGAKLELDNFDLVLDEDAQITGGGSGTYIVTKGNGRVKRKVKNDNVPVVFPVGTDVYMPVTIKQHTPGTTDYFSVKAIDGIFGNYINNNPDQVTQLVTEAIDKTWIIDEDNSGGSDVEITLQWNRTEELPYFDAANVRLSHFENGSWDDPGPAAITYDASGNATITRSGISSFSPYAVVSRIPQPLPVALISFRATNLNKAVVCNWQTAKEQNNESFTVERSLNGRDFTAIGMVKGKGTTSEISNYQFTDLKPVNGTAYYRLRQTDTKGTESFSKMVMVTTEGLSQQLAFEVYPNPAREIRYLTTQAEITQAVTVTVTNVQGQVISTQLVAPQSLQTGYAIDLKDQPKGLYFISITTPQQVVTLRTVQL